ncbi:MAG TPA: diguanylate cyclase [Thermoanaerobaculia bacterium]|nr:diguanylate cyclase [Thermoanaerobaculia bacterium]
MRFAALITGLLLALAWGAGAQTVRWSDRELAWLRSHGPIRMCVAPDWMPIEGIDANGRHVGMGADFIRGMARRGGLTIELVPTKTWDESWALGQQQRCDIFSLLMDSPSRRSFLDFTTPYLIIPGVIATSSNVPFIASLDQVEGERVGHMRGFAGVELLRTLHPRLHLIEVDSYEEGLSKVQNGELFGFIGNMMSIGWVLQQNKIYDVKIAGRIGHDNLMSIATRNDEPILHDLFQKLVDTIDPRERQEITNRWIAVRFEQGFDYRRLWQIVGVFVLVGIVTLFWATKLRRVNAKLQALNERLGEISRRDALTGLYNRLHFDEVIASTRDACAKSGTTMTLAIIDLDRFKDINDTFGHPFGDACLRQVAAMLQKSFGRDSDTTFRYGGEELIVISAGPAAEEMIERLEAFRRAIEQSLVSLDSRQSTLTVSIGVWSGVPAITDTPAQLLKHADAALYRAKRGGRNQLVVAEEPESARKALILDQY